MVNVPPRHGKSAIVSERFPVWTMGHHPDWQFLAASYAASLSEKFSRKARALVREPITQTAFPGLKLNPEKQGVEEWETTTGGVYKAMGVGGPATGSGANVLLIDDPVKGYEQAYSQVYRDKVFEWYRSDAETRLMPESGVLIVMTRWHEDDLAGRLLKEEPEDWRQVSFPAIAEQDEEHRKEGEALHPDRYPLATLERIKAKSSWVWAGLYQQRPAPDEGGILKRAYWRYYETRPERFDLIVLSWDMTFKDTAGSDYVVGQVWGKVGPDAYLLDQIRARMDFPTTVNAFKAQVLQYPNAGAKYVEDKANGPAVISMLKNQIPGLIAVEPEGGKEARAASVTWILEGGNVYLPRFAP